MPAFKALPYKFVISILCFIFTLQSSFQSDPAVLVICDDIPNEFSPLLTENEVILSDNSVDYLLGNEAEERIVTETVPNSLAVSS